MIAEKPSLLLFGVPQNLNPLQYCSLYVLNNKMRLGQEQLTFGALVALDEIVDQCSAAPVAPSPALRFILAWLYAHNLDNDRACYDAFWRIVQDDMAINHSTDNAHYLRGTQARTELMKIARRAGIELTADFQCELRQARMTKAERMIYRASPVYRFSRRHDD